MICYYQGPYKQGGREHRAGGKTFKLTNRRGWMNRGNWSV